MNDRFIDETAEAIAMLLAQPSFSETVVIAPLVPSAVIEFADDGGIAVCMPDGTLLAANSFSHALDLIRDWASACVLPYPTVTVRGMS